MYLLNVLLLFPWLLWSSVLWGLISKYYDWTSSAGLLSEWCNWCENMTGYTPPVIPLCLAGTSRCLLSTWLESSSEVWSSTVRAIEEDWGPLKQEALFNFLPMPASCISLHPGTVLRWTRFLCVFQTQRWLPGLAGTDLQKGERGGENLWMCVGRMR